MLANELSNNGHQVHVYFNDPNPQRESFTFADVLWAQHDKFDSHDSIDILIIKKYPQLLDLDLGAARAIFFWTTDPNTPEDFTPARTQKLKYVVPLTEWHAKELRELNPDLHPDQGKRIIDAAGGPILCNLGHGIEFVKDQDTKEPLDPAAAFWQQLAHESLSRGLFIETDR